MERPIVTIRYCQDCKWLLRAQWYCGELLQTFGDTLGGVTLVPGHGGIFRIEVGEQTVWNRKTDGGFPEIGEAKRRVRDVAAPDLHLGHLDRAAAARAEDGSDDSDTKGSDGAD
ncbi:SelT/SelW/SelH family protein [Dermacoccaceae bacterium W4C1]